MSCKVHPPVSGAGSSGAASPAVETLAWPRAHEEASRQASNSPEGSAAQIQRLQAECERRAAEARQDGLREGEALGRQRAAAEVEPVLQRLARSIEDIGSLRARLRREAEADLVRLALAIARRVLRRELAVDPEALRGLALAALEKLQAGEIRRVRAHPSHIASIQACLRESAGISIEIVADPGRPPGSVVFETARGDLDASIETQLSEIERGLADVLRRSS